MTRSRARALFVSASIALLTLVPLGAAPQNVKPPVVASSAALLDILRAEMTRNMAVLEKQPVPPYFLAYSVNETRSSQMSASFGALTGDLDNQARTLGVDVRTGDYALDNTREIRGEPAPPAGIGRATIPLTDSAPGVAVAAWSATDRAYRQAVERLARVKTNLAAKVKEEDPAPDFSREEPQVSVGAARHVHPRQGPVAGAPSQALRRLLRRPAHRPRRGRAERRGDHALPGHHRGHSPADRRYRAGDSPSRRSRRRTMGWSCRSTPRTTRARGRPSVRSAAAAKTCADWSRRSPGFAPRRSSIRTRGRRSCRAAPPACSSTRSSATGSKGRARRRPTTRRRSRGRSASRSCRRSSASSPIPRSRGSAPPSWPAPTRSTTKAFGRGGSRWSRAASSRSSCSAGRRCPASHARMATAAVSQGCARSRASRT